MKLKSFLAIATLGLLGASARKEYAGRDSRGVADSRKGTIAGGPRIRRNGPCPCRSGKKFKHCHGAPQ